MTDIYGSIDSIESLRSALSQYLGAEFEMRYSDYRGGDYYIAKTDEAIQYIIQKNYNSYLAEWSYPEHSESGILFCRDSIPTSLGGPY